ncbi:MAG: DUF502 domain-containing protein [Candidatus Omnitrophica bacterium]|nr:DUF502 domain-containing protein [Candidatus Omnitrophota bacterium]
MKTLWRRFFIGFLNGMIILLPVAATIMIVRFLVLKVNDIVLEPFLRLFAGAGTDIQHVFIAKGVLLLLVVFGVAFIGWAARILAINRFFSWGESILIKLPIMGKIYNAIKQISSAFIGHGKTIFKQVVLVEYPRKGVYSIGFTTGTTKGEVRAVLGQNGISVFIPTTPNPTSGIFLMVSKDDIQFLKMSVEDGMKLVISGGSVTPPYAERESG